MFNFQRAKTVKMSSDEESESSVASSHVKSLTKHCERILGLTENASVPPRSTSAESVINLGIL